MRGLTLNRTARICRKKAWSHVLCAGVLIFTLSVFTFNTPFLSQAGKTASKYSEELLYSKFPDFRHHNRNLRNILPNDNAQFHRLKHIQRTGKSLNKAHRLAANWNITLTSELSQAEVPKESEEESSVEGESLKKRRLPQAIIIGVKKGGTRALLEFLRVHPDVKATGPEPHFFDKHYQKGLDWYRNLMPETLPHQLTIEKTPSYFITKEVPARICRMSNSTKLVLVVRDPVTRAISDYTQILSKHGKSKSFQSSAFIRNDTTKINTSWIVIRIGLYVKHLENWLSVFPLKQIHFVHGENLVTNPGEEMRKVQTFLGLRTFITEDNFILNKTRGFPCIKKTMSSKRGHCLDESKGRKHPILPESVIAALRRFYRPFNAKFYRLTNINFHWT
ncbi:heparan sulfate glucosamine 3-O-sulfotransferase 6-like [Crassostrea angulata]|uniref:heparan sulfate glucosamine 3-O-sulfotransferase 6-like n=1 Tax=Magallana angulata TaxID=2784310 RepID=UPI0022B1B742|nr:heparan sulfate glucosamine 3-O-sulfotransferase 6-like [Crassostrea angulata]